MALILNIDTSTEKASVFIAENGIPLSIRVNEIQKEHASFLHLAIKDLLEERKIQITKLNAVAVIEGPGSYTGLRVSLSAAKGICYALSLPLITVGTLPCIARASIALNPDPGALYCAMVDARRMEVFTAIYDYDLKPIEEGHALILDNNSLSEYLKRKIVFAGNGCRKFQQVYSHQDAIFITDISITNALSQMSFELFQQKKFADLAYSEPLYIKDFQSF